MITRWWKHNVVNRLFPVHYRDNELRLEAARREFKREYIRAVLELTDGNLDLGESVSDMISRWQLPSESLKLRGLNEHLTP